MCCLRCLLKPVSFLYFYNRRFTTCEFNSHNISTAAMGPPLLIITYVVTKEIAVAFSASERRYYVAEPCWNYLFSHRLLNSLIYLTTICCTFLHILCIWSLMKPALSHINCVSEAFRSARLYTIGKCVGTTQQETHCCLHCHKCFSAVQWNHCPVHSHYLAHKFFRL